MASGPITSWQIDGETVEKVSDFILGGSKITADGDCNHEIKRRLLLGRKVMTKLDNLPYLSFSFNIYYFFLYFSSPFSQETDYIAVLTLFSYYICVIYILFYPDLIFTLKD